MKTPSVLLPVWLLLLLAIVAHSKHSSCSKYQDSCKCYRRQRQLKLQEKAKWRKLQAAGGNWTRDHKDDYDKYYNKHKDLEEIDDVTIHVAVDLWLENETAAIEKYGHITEWDTSTVTSMRNLFFDATYFNEPIGNWTVDCVETMYGMFWKAFEFDRDISKWNVERVTEMYSMFRNATRFNRDLPWHTPRLTGMANMFHRASRFNGDMGSWDTGKVYTMESTFRESRFNGNIAHWNTASLERTTQMFEQNIQFDHDLSQWNVAKLDGFSRMFFSATSFNHTLKWCKEGKELQNPGLIQNYAVFCFNGNQAGFKEGCVDQEVIDYSTERCDDAAAVFLASFVQTLVGFQAILARPFEFLSELFNPDNPDAVCFSSVATAMVQDQGAVAMANLRVGDSVLTKTGDYQPIFSMFHAHPHRETEFLQIYTNKNTTTTTTLESERPLELTPNHMVYVVGFLHPIPASQLAIGDYLWFQTPTQGRPVMVTKISPIVRQGLYNPLTAQGSIVVDGIVSSTYAALDGSRQYLQLAGLDVVSYQTLLHLALAPYRTYCLYVSSEACQPNKNDADGLVWYGRLGVVVRVVWLRQPVVVQALLLVMFMAVVGVLDQCLTPLGMLVGGGSVLMALLWRCTTYSSREGIHRLQRKRTGLKCKVN